MKTSDIPFIAPRPGLPRRVFLGAFLAAMATATLVGPGFVNSHTSTKETFNFTRGTTLASGENNRMKAWLLNAAQTPRSRIQIIGHSGTQGDATANQNLSQQRAQVAYDIAQSVGLTVDDFAFVGGVGGGDALKKADGESEREYQRRLARVTLETVYE